tara:strand:- start:818 stop:991 length:174 start_codon:yes stop_codon:yes gene_type:complete
MRGDRTITSGEDAKKIRDKKKQAIFNEAANRLNSKPAGYCGKCKKHYKGNYTNCCTS